jgi:hypothetical protein
MSRSRMVPDELKAIRGTRRPCRAVVSLFGPLGPDPEDIPPPAGMTPEGADAWREKIEHYRRRGQAIAPFVDVLRHYVELEVMLNSVWASGGCPPAAAINAYRLLCAEFYDLPSSAARSRKG